MESEARECNITTTRCNSQSSDSQFSRKPCDDPPPSNSERPSGYYSTVQQSPCRRGLRHSHQSASVHNASHPMSWCLATRDIANLSIPSCILHRPRQVTMGSIFSHSRALRPFVLRMKRETRTTLPKKRNNWPPSSGFGSAIWRGAVHPGTINDLAVQCLALYGKPDAPPRSPPVRRSDPLLFSIVIMDSTQSRFTISTYVSGPHPLHASHLLAHKSHYPPSNQNLRTALLIDKRGRKNRHCPRSGTSVLFHCYLQVVAGMASGPRPSIRSFDASGPSLLLDSVPPVNISTPVPHAPFSSVWLHITRLSLRKRARWRHFTT